MTRGARAKFALILFSLVIGTVAHASMCEQLFIPGENIRYGSIRIATMSNRLAETQKVQVIHDGATLEHNGFDAFFHRLYRVTLLNPKFDSINQFFRLYHETVHSTTDHRLHVNPADPENALALHITRPEGTIDASLPQRYQQNFQADEMKAYQRESALIFQMARTLRLEGDAKAKMAEEIANDNIRESNAFATVTYKVLRNAEAELMNAKRGYPLQMSAEMYAADTPNVVVIKIALPQASGAPIYVSLPLYDTSAASGKIENLYDKLLVVVRNGQHFAKKYITP